ncbi:MAG: type II secretion system protein [Chlamydiia bacterium]|nr:type II secretion system protein [Chlamydiia bacterium]
MKKNDVLFAKHEAKKYSFTLLEVVMGLSLIALILGFVMTSLFQQSYLKKNLSLAEEVVIARAFCQQRLDKLFATISSDPDISSTPLFTHQEKRFPTLNFTFNNGIDPNPDLSGEVHAKLVLEEDALKLIIEEVRTHILRNGVKGVTYEFLDIGEEVSVHKEWDESVKHSPAYLKITLKREDEDEHYVCWVNHISKGIPIGVKE